MLKLKMKGKALTLGITVLLVLGFFQAHVPAASAPEGPTLAAPFIIEPNLVPGPDPFPVFITVRNVSELFGYEFVLFYNTSVLTAINYGPFPPFTYTWPGEINDTAGYVAMSFSFPFGEEIGFDTVDPAPIGWIDFVVDDFGTSVLDLSDTGLIHVDGSPMFHDSEDGFFANVAVYDIAVTDVAVFPTTVMPGESVTINVTVMNQGIFNQTEPFNVTVSYDGDLIETQTVTFLGAGENTTLTFTWDTTGVAVGNYEIKAEATVVSGETDTDNNTFIDGTVSLTLEPIISITPTSGQIGTKVQVMGRRFGAKQFVVLSFDDMLMAEVYANDQGNFTAVFNVPLSEAGAHLVKAWYDSSSANVTFTVIDMSPIDINVEVGQIHFRGELAEFYIQTVFKGTPINVTTLKATLHKPDGTTETLTIEQIAAGLYKTPYTIPANAPTGTHVLIVEANRLTDIIDSKGTSIESFLLSPTLTGWNALLVSINETVGTIKMDMGLVYLKLDAINTTIESIEGTIVTIQTDIGTIKADVTAINAKITSIEGNIATIETDVGTIKTDIDTIEARIITIDGNTVTLETTLQSINGTITSIQGDVATIETDVGAIKTTLEEWTGGTITSIITPTGSFNVLVLTTSSLESLTFSDNTITILVSGPDGTTGTANAVIPKQLLVDIESTIEGVAATVNNEQVIFTYTEHPETYVLSISYTHSTQTIKIFLAGMPQPPLPLVTILTIAFAIAIITVAAALYIKRARKKTIEP